MRSVFGQFVWWRIAAGVLDKKDGWRKMEVFSVLSNIKLMNCFFNYFIMVASPATVCSKANSLPTMCRAARIRFSSHLRMAFNVDNVMIYLSCTLNAAKVKVREQMRLLQCTEERIRTQAIVTEADMSKGVRVARKRAR